MGGHIFTPCDDADKMFFVTNGRLRYTVLPVPSQLLQADLTGQDIGLMEWLCEAVLWVEWKHCGMLVAGSDCTLVALVNHMFDRIVVMEGQVHAAAILYARRFQEVLNAYGRYFTDYIEKGCIIDIPL